MSEDRTMAIRRTYTVKVLPPVRAGSAVEFPENWQVIGCDVTGDPGGNWVELVVLIPSENGRIEADDA